MSRTWDPNDPRGADPVAGRDGHFDHHTWLKEGTLRSNEEVDDLRLLLATVIARLDALELKVP